jgi:hypothetical protein
MNQQGKQIKIRKKKKLLLKLLPLFCTTALLSGACSSPKQEVES